MVIDTIENCAHYFGMHPDFERVFRWLRAADADALTERRYVIEEGRLWVSVQRYVSKPREECAAEGHEKFIDIQYVVRGREAVGYEPRAGSRALSDYDAEHDIQFFEDHCDLITIPTGSFYIAAPDDLHLTKCACVEPEEIIKLVAKVKCQAAKI